MCHVCWERLLYHHHVGTSLGFLVTRVGNCWACSQGFHTHPYPSRLVISSTIYLSTSSACSTALEIAVGTSGDTVTASFSTVALAVHMKPLHPLICSPEAHIAR